MKTEKFRFELVHEEKTARAGLFLTPHGALETPVFAPVGTQATVKSMTPIQLEEAGATLILANTYHLYLRPGAELVEELGGLHKFMGWTGPILTDSGGFQVFSLSSMRKIDSEGATFRSYIDGSIHRLTPQKAIQIQEKLGADIIMAFDECADPSDRAYIIKAMHRTHDWAEKCLHTKKRPDQVLFGIVQGGVFPDLRRESAKTITSMDFSGYAIGGLSVGESKEQMHAMIEIVNEVLPADKPRYLMGVGSPEDIINGILRGIDIFDCVLPTRLARHQAAFTRHGRINLVNAMHARDPGPIDPTCECYACRHFSRAYLRHLIMAKEMLSGILISIHNVQFLTNLVKNARQAIMDHDFDNYAQRVLADWYQNTTLKEKA